MKTVTVEGFEVAGREARTTNAREMSGQGVIGKMWGEGVPMGGPVVVVYSGYESDKDGAYDYLLGVKLGESVTAEKEAARKRVASGPYVVLTFAGEVSAEAVVGLWGKIWEMEATRKIERAYKTDFEMYGTAGIELYVGVKEAAHG